MTDRVLIPLGDRLLALDRSGFEAALRAGDEMLPPRARPEALIGGAAPPKLLTAEEMAAETGVPASWFLAAARRDEIPYVRFQKYVRFDPLAVRSLLEAPGPYRTSNPVAPRKPLTEKGKSTAVSGNVPKRSEPDRSPVGARNGR